MPLVACCRSLPFPLDIPGCEVRYGGPRGVMRAAELHGFVRGADAVVTWFCDKIDGAVMDAAGPQLKVMSNYAVGFDNIDLAAAKQRGIVITNTPDAVTEGTADMAWALLLAAARRLAHADRFARDGRWPAAGILGPADLMGQPIAGRTLLIVGAGRIGYATALRSTGWGMKVLYHARGRKPQFEFAPLNAKWVELDDGLKQADFISIHTPLTPDTRHIIDARRLGLMKPSAVLVNTSRGPTVDEAALAVALRDGKLFAAGLDVFEREPAIDPVLLTLENVVMAPHIGSANLDSRKMMVDLCAANIRAVLAGKPAVTPVNA
jgi:glyoxylate reductase